MELKFKKNYLQQLIKIEGQNSANSVGFRPSFNKQMLYGYLSIVIFDFLKIILLN